MKSSNAIYPVMWRGKSPEEPGQQVHFDATANQQEPIQHLVSRRSFF